MRSKMNLGERAMESYQEEVAKVDLRIRENMIKANEGVKCQLYLAEQKQLMQEADREIRKSQYEQICFSDSGEIYVQTQNLRTKAESRKHFTFQSPEIYIIEHSQNRRERLLMLMIEIYGEDRWTILSPEKCGGGTYLLRKINMLGGDVLADSLATRKNLARGLITECIKKSTKKIILPEERGWMEDCDGKITFFDEELTWKEAKKCAK